MLRRLREKNPVLTGIVLGYGLMLLFVFMEVILVKTGISNCGLIEDSIFRIFFGIIMLLLLRTIYRKEFNTLFTKKISSHIWIFCLPIFSYLLLEFCYLPSKENFTTDYIGPFLLIALQQITVGFFEEAGARGLVMSGMLEKWTLKTSGRILAVFLTGFLFGSLHYFDKVLFGADAGSALFHVLTSGMFGTLMAALYMNSENLLLCMILHALWDIIINVPGNFFNYYQQAPKFTTIYTIQMVVYLLAFPIVAIIMCIRFKRN